MCLIALHHAPGEPIVLRLIANRDEFHARPTAPLAEWPDTEGIIGGRDLQAGGSWLAVHRRGRVAALTNVRDPRVTSYAEHPSRGHLVTAALRTNNLASWLQQLADGEALAYAGFNLLVGDGQQLWHLHRGHQGIELNVLSPGVYGLSNANLNTAWPKLIKVRQALARSLALGDWPATAQCAFADDQRAADRDLPDTGIDITWERQLSAAFIRGQQYGTRATTCLEWHANGNLSIEELSHGPDIASETPAAPSKRHMVIHAPVSRSSLS
ncbi:NRDE family protein [Halomonas halocynthiae]|uniref:NRDE family protein n=1 Tax=Halomonas halocynthiae TaxID=176290 RepID=UPI0003FF009D|nr:NRDE family protein [Halomonas halocynthiae]